MAIKVIYNVDSYTEVTRAADPDVKWDGYSTSTSHNLVSASLVSITKLGRFDGAVDFDIQPNVAYYGVCYSSSTGNSFGYDDGAYFDVVDLFKTEEEARNVAKRIKDNDIDGYSFKWTSSSGEARTTSARWKGCFESLDWVQTFRVAFDGTGHGVIYDKVAY